MSLEELPRGSARKCRLCMAPDDECISIFDSYAADKEPLATKILDCVNIKITPNDRMSKRICHACISFLNSWQSFKNRCILAQTKQRGLLKNQAQLESNNVSIIPMSSDGARGHQQEHENDDGRSEDYSSSLLDGISSLKKRRSLTVYPVPPVTIKEEPVDHEEEIAEDIDPTQFLERTEEEGHEPIMPSFEFEQQNKNVLQQLSISNDSKEASCRACNLKFSTRANARRHERNLHPNLFELSSASPNNMLVTKPTPALAAALELQRVAAVAAQEAASKSGGVLTQKFRQEVVNAFNKCETGGYDYDHPEKYQDLLTDEKIVFLQQNDDFLKQYQSMTCRCCNRLYSTYKNFMAHMRKKYATLPRNLCFNCLKLNDSKALFISHLKRRNCINLYKVLHTLMAKDTEFAAAVSATAAAVPEKLRVKELLVNKMYECKLCPKKYRLKLEFRSHVYNKHSDAQRKDISSSQCCYCALEFQDPAERKRHYNNMDCIVSLRCVTCDAKFDNHQQFLDHVYGQHLAGFGEQSANSSFADNRDSIVTGGGNSSNDDSRSLLNVSAQQKSQYFSRQPQACTICGQQYNNYNNVLRHMESKHPDKLPQTYKCVKCGTGYPRLSNLREHMVTVHAVEKAKHTGFEYIVNSDAVKPTNGTTYGGRYDYVMKDLMSITNGSTACEDDENNVEQAPKKIKLDTSANNSNSNLYTTVKECPICSAVFSNNIGLSNHMRSHAAAAQNSALNAAKANTNSILSSTTKGGKSTMPTNMLQNQTPQQQTIFKRSLEQAAERRFRRMRCRICQRRFSSKKSYRFHMLNDHQIRNVQFIKCKLCNAEFAYEKGLKVHMFKIHNTLLKDEMIIKQFECDICSIVYRTEEQLLQHKKNIHGAEDAHADMPNVSGRPMDDAAGTDMSGISTPVSTASGKRGGGGENAVAGPLYWYQCKYCPSNFDTNKKLAIHINSHDEFDSKDYSCKDCGNVYSGRKSLWVHRYKKHPQIPDPSECVLCKKVFFDSQMLEKHIPTCNRIPITSTGAHDTSVQTYKHKTGDDDSHDGDGARVKMPEVACTICGERFVDQDLFSRHIQMHEQELYTDNPLASMFDTGPTDPNQFFLDRVNDMGEYVCDLCPKTFTQMTAFKVHRKWHFRGDSKQSQEPDYSQISAQTLTNLQHPPGLQAVGLIPNQSIISKSSPKRKRQLKCEYCETTFISNNNLRRHIYEVHKEAMRNLPQPPKIKLDSNQECRRCNLKFDSKALWIEHKISEARIMKPFGPFQWGCDLCGAYVSRKEKLINHLQNHMKEKVIVPADQLELESEAHMSNSMQQYPQHQSANRTSEREELPKISIKLKSDLEIKEEPKFDYDIEDGDEDDSANENDENEEDEEVADEAEYEDVEEDVEAESDAEESDAKNVNHEKFEVDEDDDVEDDEDDIEMNEDEIIESKRLDGQELENSPSAEEDEDDEDDEEEDEDEVDDDVDDADDDVDNTKVEDDEDDDEEMEADDDDISLSSSEQQTTKTATAKSKFSCDLCRLYFDSQQELQKHVKWHFLNGPGSVSLSEFKPKSSNKSSRSSSSDMVAASSS